MPRARTIQRAASTYVVHFFGGGLDRDERFVVERYETAASGEIRPLGAAGEDQGVGARKARTTLSRRAVKRLRPLPNEIVIATAVGCDAGMQLFGDAAAGIALRGRWRC